MDIPPVDASNPGTGSANPTDPNYSWPAFWGDRNSQNETANDTILNNPAGYTDPSWTLGGNWDPTNALSLVTGADLQVPEPATTALLAGLIILPLALRPRRRSLAR